jgi:NAD-dependent dihydropyrimidine dehydrogenase PreA subunit/flavodoxin
MIFYFTGTGNSFYAAKVISEANNETLISIAEEMKNNTDGFQYSLKENDTIGFVYPVYAWAPPHIVIDFIDKMRLHNYKNNYIFSIATCGDNVGNTMDVLKTALGKKGLELNSGFSIAMPNNYILLGDVDSKEVEKEKLVRAEDRLNAINTLIKERRKGLFDLEKGFFPSFLTGVISPLFNKFGVDTKKFYATDACTSCGLCERICTTNTIKVNRKPTWGSECVQCLACIHRCPVQAIQYGKATLKKGRYKNPSLT